MENLQIEETDPLFKDPFKHLLNPEDICNFKCILCFEFTFKPIQCAGTCRQVFCQKCYSKWKDEKNQCPSRCSEPFIVKKVENPKIGFKCPYSSDCNKAIQSFRDFKSHHQFCDLISETDSEQILYRDEYKCKRGHQL